MTSGALQLLQSKEAGLGVSDITQHQFFARVKNIRQTESLDEFMGTGQQAISYLLMGLNLATLGHFIWSKNKLDIYPQFSVIDPTRTHKTKMLKFDRDKTFPTDELRDLTKEDVQRAVLLFVAIGEEPIKQVTQEYLKGVYHLSLEIFEMKFEREAFSNFYRSAEFFVTDRVLNVQRLTNELKDMQRAIRDLGLGDKIAEEFRNLYQTRSEQVMHAQREQNDIDRDTVLKMKMIADAIMNKVYEPIWKDKLK